MQNSIFKFWEGIRSDPFRPSMWRSLPRSYRTACKVSVWSAALVIIGLGSSEGDLTQNVAVLFCLVGIVATGRRAVAVLSVAVGFATSYPPLSWPTYWFCLTPLIWLIRSSGSERSRWAVEAFGMGFAACWLSAPFLGCDYGRGNLPIRMIASALFGLQWVVMVASLRATRCRALLLAAPAAAAVAVGCEWLRMVILGWPLLALGLPAAPTPIAQWAVFGGPFAVSWILYLVNFLAYPDSTRSRPLSRYAPPVAAAVLIALALFGGRSIAKGVPCAEDPPLNVVMVQPNLMVPPLGWDYPTLHTRLDRLTRGALVGAKEGVDLVVWPEAVIPRSYPRLDARGGGGQPRRALAEFYRDRMPNYGVPCLVGALIETNDGRLYNSACFITPDGSLTRYDKQLLVVLAEGMPTWLDNPGFRQLVWSWLGIEGLFSPGSSYRPFSLTTRSGHDVRFGVVICYERHFPWLRQFQEGNRVDVVIHLSNESSYAAYPGQPQHSTWASQYRAIESRSWQFVCATWGHSAVIDPRGRIRAVLPIAPGVLQTSGGSVSRAIH